MAIRDLRKHTSWYLKGFPVGGNVRRRLMECTSVEQLKHVLDGLDLTAKLDTSALEKPRGRARYQKKVHVPDGWLNSRRTTKEERLELFGDDPMDSPY